MDKKENKLWYVVGLIGWSYVCYLLGQYVHAVQMGLI